MDPPFGGLTRPDALARLFPIDVCMASIDLCIGRVKAEASERAALVDACSPHGRAVLTQSQKRSAKLHYLARS